MRQPGTIERAADETDIIARAAAAARLRHDDGQPVGVVFARQHRLHDLPDNGDRRVAGVVIYIFESGVNGRTTAV